MQKIEENKKNGHKLQLNDNGEKNKKTNKQNNFALRFPLSLKVICIRCRFIFSTSIRRQNKVSDKHCAQLKLNNFIKQLAGRSTRRRASTLSPPVQTAHGFDFRLMIGKLLWLTEQHGADRAEAATTKAAIWTVWSKCLLHILLLWGHCDYQFINGFLKLTFIGLAFSLFLFFKYRG